LILTYSATTITLPDPTLGNTEQIDTNSILRRSRGGELKAVDRWHNDHIYSYEFNILTAAEKDALINFIRASAGQEVSMTFLTDTYVGVIISDELEFITLRDGCTYSTALEFRGRLT